MARQLGVPVPADWESAIAWGGLQAGEAVATPAAIFPRIDRKSLAAEAQTAAAPAQQRETPNAPAAATIGIEDFARVELRVVEIVAAERVPKADKLLQLRVSLGEQERTVLAGIAAFYAPEQLI